MRCMFTTACAVATVMANATGAAAQDTAFTFIRARQLARDNSPDIVAARHAVDAARARARQAGAFLNPAISYNREQTGAAGQAASQDIITVDQVLENPGVRSARRDGARHRLIAAEARLRAAELQVSFEAVRAYATAVAADRRAELADQAARAFAAAMLTSERRLREGDISGFAARRIRLEAARYSVLRAEASLTRSTARLHLATLTMATVDSALPLRDPVIAAIAIPPTDSLVAVALRSRPEIVAQSAEVLAASAETRLSARERLPSVSLVAGTKSEETIDGERLGGFVAGVSVPLPLWDRRGGAVAASRSEARRREAELVASRRAVAREAREAADALRSAREQLRALGPDLRADAATALRSAQVAYAEGELTLIEWLDTVRAFYETETAMASLGAELLIRAAALDRAAGTTLLQDPQ